VFSRFFTERVHGILRPAYSVEVLREISAMSKRILTHASRRISTTVPSTGQTGRSSLIPSPGLNIYKPGTATEQRLTYLDRGMPFCSSV